MLDDALTRLSDALADRDRAAAETADAPDPGSRSCWELERATAELRAGEARRQVAAALALAFAACREIDPGVLARMLWPELDPDRAAVPLGVLSARADRLRDENWDLARAIASLERRVETLEHERGRAHGAGENGPVGLRPGGRVA